MTEMLAYTNAPECYDYWYVKTLKTLVDKDGKDWRLLEVSDESRFENFQRPRYGSGLKQSFTEEDADEITYRGLPSL